MAKYQQFTCIQNEYMYKFKSGILTGSVKFDLGELIFHLLTQISDINFLKYALEVEISTLYNF